MATQLIAYAKIKSNSGVFVEDFKVDSKESAEQEVKATVQYFNDTLKPGESPRSFEGITHFQERIIPGIIDDEYNDWEWEEDDDDNYDLY